MKKDCLKFWGSLFLLPILRYERTVTVVIGSEPTGLARNPNITTSEIKNKQINKTTHTSISTHTQTHTSTDDAPAGGKALGQAELEAIGWMLKEG